jgi:hypothetical protein
MKLPEFVGLVNVSIAVDLKSFKNLAKRSKSGRQFRISQSKLDFWNFSILHDRKLKLLQQILFNELNILLSGNIFVRRFLSIKNFPTKITFGCFHVAPPTFYRTFFWQDLSMLVL